jgi:hypothetical protein
LVLLALRTSILAVSISAVFGGIAVGSWQIVDRPAIRDSPLHPRSSSPTEIEGVVNAGRRLFQTRFNVLDGAGRPSATGDSKPTFRLQRNAPMFHRVSGPDASSCASCHNQPRLGSAGDFATNVFQGAHFLDPLNDSIAAGTTNERGTTSLFGAGAVEALAREMSEDLTALREDALRKAAKDGRAIKVSLSTKGVEFGYLIARPDGTYDASGITGVDPDLIVKPFGVKGVAISIREFTVFALNHHHGIQPVERFGQLRTGVRDFDGDGIEAEFSVGQVTALTLFQAMLPAPVRSVPESSSEETAIRIGEQAFAVVGCTQCHIPSLPLRNPVVREPNSFNRPGATVPSDEIPLLEIPLASHPNSGVFRDETGTVRVAAFTDLKRHRICDDEDPFFCNERIAQDFVPTDQFLTMKLWDVGSTGPYGHRGNLTTISEAILHHAGEATPARLAFSRLPEASRRAIVAFLNSLVVPSSDAETTFIRGRRP